MSFTTIVHNPFGAYDPGAIKYARWKGNNNVLMPFEFTDWVEETQSWKESCYISYSLSGITANLPVKGPDAERLMSENFVNSFTLDKFPVGRAKHVIAVSEKGNITMDGVVLRMAPDHFDTYCLDPQVPILVNSGRYNVEAYTPEYNRDFIFQLSGPRSLEIIENAARKDIHDLRFMAFTHVEIAGCWVRILRMGMGGTLGYEVHGSAEDAITVYNELIRVGEAYGLKKLGIIAYMSNHTENGFPQGGTHFMYAWEEDPSIAKYMGLGVLEEADDHGMCCMKDYTRVPLLGSMGDAGMSCYFQNPYEVGWGRSVNFDHDFVGKEALQKMSADPNTRRVCTLEWNADDVAAIYRAYYDEDKEIPEPLVMPRDYYYAPDGNWVDKVFDSEGNLVGRSAGQTYTRYYKKMISLAAIHPDYCQEGRELTVLWGTPGKRQFRVRATVARFPYLDLADNRNFDMESIPHYVEK